MGPAGRQAVPQHPTHSSAHVEKVSTCLSPDVPDTSLHPTVNAEIPWKSTLPGSHVALTWIALETGGSLSSKEAGSLGRTVAEVGEGKEMTSGCKVCLSAF